MIEPSTEIEQALANDQAVVALETTLICHGLPRPENLETARRLEQEVRDAGAVPATVGVIDGRVRVGLTDEQLRRLAESHEVDKCSTRDLARVAASGGLGATTVAATIYAAHRVGVRFMATGGLGGVHRGGERSLDVSADIGELARSPSIIVCSGIKSILDIGRTLEALETAGVSVLAMGTGDLPGFYVTKTGFEVPAIAGVEQAAATIEAHAALGWPGSIVIANPPPEDLALDPAEHDELLLRAEAEASAAGVSGKEVTPRLLAALAEATRGRSVALNTALVRRNSRMAAMLACAHIRRIAIE